MPGASRRPPRGSSVTAGPHSCARATARGGAARAEASAALGCGYTLRNHDLVGFVASGARPSDGALRDQYTLQLFYNLALGEHVHLTPDLQVVFDPSLNPSEDVIAFLGLRLRLDF